MPPKVSVQIVTYNSSHDIASCLEAVIHQTHPVDEIIVVDNASADHTVKVVEAFLSRHESRVHLVQNERNTGFAPAHNQGIRLSKSDYVLVLNPDVVLAPDYIKLLVEMMERNPTVGSATGMLVFQDNEEIIDSTGLVMNRIWRAFDRGAGEPRQQWSASGEVFGVSGAAAIYSRNMIDDISIQGQFFDEDFFAYKEDVDVAWRAELLGWKAYYCAEALGIHKRGWKKGQRGARPLFIRQRSFINRYKMIYKNLLGAGWTRNLPQLLAYEISVHVYMLLREPNVLGAWVDFWRQRPNLKAKRRELKEKVLNKNKSKVTEASN
ncbi:glycosyltransferase family 2 protein [Paenibacillus sp. alder61]|uniref:glycosyltransferase family 2 protein n=1 Tax=Paenibacillus sp. alder61 TaxID=2862948 RepID=UPI001CD1E1C7|nr:glycosyltransferase family 2 protein [Paenibacillus sp. alder61]MCA1293911.1 glycosyltransferase family 2 protein [Paenibacillus sp. alder61]